MKIKKLIDLCKKRGCFYLFEDERVQWLSDGVALYPLYNVPEFDEETLCRTFDITEKQQEKSCLDTKCACPLNTVLMISRTAK